MVTNSLIIFSAFLVLLLSISYAYLKWHYSFWKRHGVPHEDPHLIWGNIQGVGVKQTLADSVRDTYLKFRGQAKICGMFMMTTKFTVICDFDLVKRILITDFEKFSDRGNYCNGAADPLSNNLVDQRVPEWRILRPKLQPMFSSAKLKGMVPIMDVIVDKMLDRVKSFQGQQLNVAYMFDCLATDIINNCALGLDTNSFGSEPNEFMKNSKMMIVPVQNPVLRLAPLMYNKFCERIGVRVIPLKISEFFFKLAQQSLEYRENKGIYRDDIFQSLMEMKNDSALTVDEVAAQMFIFQFAGHGTTSRALTYATYELAMHPEIQETLRAELENVLRNEKGGLTYESFFVMNYLDRVVKEVLRKYPPTRILTRRVTVDEYHLPGTSVRLKRGDLVTIPTLGFHYDPDIYPRPQVFDPDRFLSEVTQLRSTMAYLPFGEGHRICFGLRFALLEIKIVLCRILLEYRLERGDDLPEKLESMAFGPILTPRGEINIRFTKLDK